MQQKKQSVLVSVVQNGIFLIGCGGVLASAQDTTASTDHRDELPPAFRLTPQQIDEAVHKGQEYAKKNGTFSGMMNKVRQNPSWTRGKSGKSHESYVWATNLDGLAFSAAAFQCAKRYETLNLPEKAKTTGAYFKAIRFEVHLTSVPHIARYRWEKERAADEQDVKVIKFVLSDDQGHNFDATSSEGNQSSGTVTFSGSTPHTTTGSVGTSGTTNTNAFGSDGSSATATSSSQYTSTWTRTEYIPWTTQRPYFQAKYFVDFALFGVDSHALIKSDVKQITLHIITESGELSTTYKL